MGLNGRGAMQVILGTAGLTAGLLSSAAYTIVILMSIISSVLVPPLLRRTLHRWEGTEEEQQRLREEKELSTNVIVRGQRLLLPSRGSTNSFTAARILDLAWPPTSEVTVLSIGSNGNGSNGNGNGNGNGTATAKRRTCRSRTTCSRHARRPSSASTASMRSTRSWPRPISATASSRSAPTTAARRTGCSHR